MLMKNLTGGKICGRQETIVLDIACWRCNSWLKYCGRVYQQMRLGEPMRHGTHVTETNVWGIDSFTRKNVDIVLREVEPREAKVIE